MQPLSLQHPIDEEHYYSCKGKSVLALAAWSHSKEDSFLAEYEDMNILYPRRRFLSGGCCMNYGKVGRRRRVLFQRGQLRGGGCPGAAGFCLPRICFPEWGERSAPRQHTPHTPPRPQQAEGAGGALGANLSQFGVICCPEEQVGGCRENGGSFAWVWMRGGCWGPLGGVTAASLGASRGEARWQQPHLSIPCSPPCFPQLLRILVLGGALEMRMLSTGPMQHPVGLQRRRLAGGSRLLLAGSWRCRTSESEMCCSPVPRPLPASPALGAAAALLQHSWVGRRRG